MKTENYPKNDGTQGVRYILEKGDVIEAKYSKPRETLLGGSKYPSYSIKAVWDDNEIFVALTHGQYKRLMGIGDLDGKKLVAVGYPGAEGKELVGLEALD
ncbi:MAG: hypothetical protein K8R02_07780 [Anaerohalosphaeraceae bacterium]|nr:hypothetical protein [Anaerohalosphaeraceae bacterium]